MKLCLKYYPDGIPLRTGISKDGILYQADPSVNRADWAYACVDNNQDDNNDDDDMLIPHECYLFLDLRKVRPASEDRSNPCPPGFMYCVGRKLRSGIDWLKDPNQDAELISHESRILRVRPVAMKKKILEKKRKRNARIKTPITKEIYVPEWFVWRVENIVKPCVAIPSIRKNKEDEKSDSYLFLMPRNLWAFRFIQEYDKLKKKMQALMTSTMFSLIRGRRTMLYQGQMLLHYLNEELTKREEKEKKKSPVQKRLNFIKRENRRIQMKKSIKMMKMHEPYRKSILVIPF